VVDGGGGINGDGGGDGVILVSGESKDCGSDSVPTADKEVDVKNSSRLDKQ
jgi:hypothetical protein